MSFRPTISIYAEGKIADIRFYPNWEIRHLIMEATALGVIFAECHTVEEYKKKVFGTQKVYYSVEPENFENTQENLKMLESWSEFPLFVDLTSGYLYHNDCALSAEEQADLPAYEGSIRQLTEDEDGPLPAPFREKMDSTFRKTILGYYRDMPVLLERLSEQTAARLRDML